MPRQNNFDKYLEDYVITDRVSHLRDVYFQAMPEICIERPSLIAKYCIKNSLFGKERISILDKAKMYRYVLAKRKPMVRHRHGFESRGPGKKMRRFTFSDNSLFAGSTTSKFKGVPIFPEFLGLSIWPELKNISIRHKNPYQLSKKDARILNEQVFPHWMEENILEKTRSRCRDNGNDPVGINLLQHIVFFMTTKINCISHTIPDFKRVVGEGLDEIIREAIEKRKNTDNAAKREFYSAVIEAMKGIIAYSTNLAKEAERLALKEDNPVKKQELLDIAEIHRHIPRHPARTFREGLTAIGLEFLILTTAAFFLIRSYVLSGDALLVQRLGWHSRLDLSGLRSAEVDPQAMAKSTRTFGNGGMFCFAGVFRNKKLGSYRAFATDPNLSVILKFNTRVVVVTPGNPEGFVSRIRELRNL